VIRITFDKIERALNLNKVNNKVFDGVEDLLNLNGQYEFTFAQRYIKEVDLIRCLKGTTIADVST